MIRTKGSRSEIGNMYRYAVTVLIAAELSMDPDVEDYVIYSNDASAGKFNDVVAKVKLKGKTDSYLSLIQIKYKEIKQLNISDILKEKGVQYVISGYIESFNKTMADETIQCRRGICSKNIRFGIFSNAYIETPVSLHKDGSFELNLCKYSHKDRGNDICCLPFTNDYWKFVCNDLGRSECQHFVKECYLRLNEPNYDEINKYIQNKSDISNANEIINYVKDYFNDIFLGKQGLRKEVFEIELQRIRVYDYILPVTPLAQLVNDDRIPIWNKITLSHDITSVSAENDIDIVFYLSSCLIQCLSTLLNIEIEFPIKGNHFKEILKKFRDYSKTRPLRYWISEPTTIQSLLIEIWKCGGIPLMLQTHQKLTDFEKYMHLKRAYIIVDKLSTETFDTKLKIFKCIKSISDHDLRDRLLTNTPVSLQGRKECTLKDLVGEDVELMATFTTSHILGFMKKSTASFNEAGLNGIDYLAFIIEDDSCTNIVEPLDCLAIGKNIKIYCHPNMIQDCFKLVKSKYRNYRIYHLRRTDAELELIRGDKDKLRHYFIDQNLHPLYNSGENQLVPIIGQTIMVQEINYVHRSLTKATISRSFLSSLEKKICLLFGDLECIGTDIPFTEVTSNVDEIISTAEKSYFLKSPSESSKDYMNALSDLGFPLISIFVRNGEMELTEYRNCNNLSDHILYQGTTFPDNDFFDEIPVDRGQIILITGVAGMGKSCLLKYLCSIFSLHYYILFYDLINFQSFQFKNKDTLQDPLEFIVQEFHKGMPSKYNNFLNGLQKKKRLLLVLDSFDEIVLACEKEVLEFIRLLTSTGIQMIISTRLESSNILIDKFNVRTVKLNSLNNSTDNKGFSFCKLSNTLIDNIPTELTTNPLYLNLLSMISLDKEQLSEMTKFTLFEKVFHLKIEHTVRRSSRVFYKAEVEQTVSVLQNLALVAMFGKEMVEQELMWACDGTLLDYTKFGIITHFNDSIYPVFYHYTFVEYLVAQWLSKAQHIRIYKNFAKILYKKLFRGNKLHLLDILSEDVKPHRASMRNDFLLMYNTLTENPGYYDAIDKLGRTILHILAICSRRSHVKYATYNYIDNIIMLMRQWGSDTDKRDTIAGWSWIDYLPSDFVEDAVTFRYCNSVEVYLNIRTKNINQFTTEVTTLSNFSKLFQYAIDYLSIETIGNLLILQYCQHTKFDFLYQACVKSTLDYTTPYVTESWSGIQLDPLHIAVIYGSVQMAQYIIATGGNVNALDEFGCTPLYYSIIGCSPAVSKDRTGYHPEKMLTSECATGLFHENLVRLALVKILLENGARNDIYCRTNSALHLAVLRKNIDAVRILLEGGANANFPDECLDTPLHAATRNGFLDIIQLLLNYDANPHIQNGYGLTCSDIALTENNIDIIQLFSNVKINDWWYDLARTNVLLVSQQNKQNIEQFVENVMSSNVNEGFMNGVTLLHVSAYTGNVKHIQFLIENGCSINLQSSDGTTPLHFAVRSVNANTVRLLLEYGADANISDKDGATPFYTAIRIGNMNVIKEFLGRHDDCSSQKAFTGESFVSRKLQVLTKTDVNVQNHTGATPLLFAANENNIDLVKIMLQNGANVNENCYGLLTGLHLTRDINVMKLLLDNGADPNALDKAHNTPLHIAVLANNIDIVKVLLTTDVNLNIPNMFNFTPLFIAVVNENIEITRLLLEKGANVNFNSNMFSAPIHAAAKNSEINILKLLLLNRDIDVNARDVRGSSPLHIAAEAGKEDIVKILLDCGANVNAQGDIENTPLHVALYQQNIEVAKLLLCKEVDVNLSNKYEETPLLYAAEKGNLDIVSLLLEKNADVNAESYVGTTPLYSAIFKGYTNIANLLLKRQANVNAQDKNGYTPLHTAIFNQDLSAIALLLKFGADVNIANADGDTAFMYAKDKAHYNIHEKFVEIQNTVPQVRTADEIRDLCLSQTGVDIAKLLLEKHKISDVSSENKYEFEIEDFFDFLQENYVTRFLLNNEISAGSKTSDDNSDEELQ